MPEAAKAWSCLNVNSVRRLQSKEACSRTRQKRTSCEFDIARLAGLVLSSCHAMQQYRKITHLAVEVAISSLRVKERSSLQGERLSAHLIWWGM